MNDDSADRPAGPQDGNNPGPSVPGSEMPRRLRFGARLRTYFFAGILVTAPISITFYLAWLLISFVDRRVTPLIPEQYNPENYLPFTIPGLGVVVMVVVLTLIGAVTAGFVGRLWMRVSERFLGRMPVIRSIYGAIKQIIETIVAQKSQAFREAVLVEYPRRGIWAIGFMTGKTEGEVQNLTKESVTNVFLPTTPNPTSGFLLFVPTKDLVPLSMTVEEAIKMVISGGIVTPADQRPKSVRDVPVVSAATFEEVDILREQDGAPVLAIKKD